MPKAEIYALGSEIVLGQTIDTNSAWISSKLNDLGIETVKHVAIADDIEIIKSDLENNLLYLKGSIPGSKNTEVLVKKAIKNIKKLTIKEKIERTEKAKKTPDKKKK